MSNTEEMNAMSNEAANTCNNDENVSEISGAALGLIGAGFVGLGVAGKAAWDKFVTPKIEAGKQRREDKKVERIIKKENKRAAREEELNKARERFAELNKEKETKKKS